MKWHHNKSHIEPTDHNTIYSRYIKVMNDVITLKKTPFFVVVLLSIYLEEFVNMGYYTATATAADVVVRCSRFV